AITKKEQIFIHGDFDVDGVCATALLWEYLYWDRGANVLPYIPSRVDEGYGMSGKSLDAIAAKGGKLVISVDCGIRDTELVRSYRTRSRTSLDFIITDHHEPGDELPATVPVVHPLHSEHPYPEPYISGSMVAWKLVAALEKKRTGKKFLWQSVPGADLAAFATVADIMPLTGENRVIVSKGLEYMNRSPREGIRAMLIEAGVPFGSVTAYHLGYIIGPRINAAGRIGDVLVALRLMTTRNAIKAGQLAQKLGELNKQRQDMTEELLSAVRFQIEQESKGAHVYIAAGNDWPEGIIGLVAGKLQEEYNRPVILISKKDGISRGSARSISQFNIIEAIESAKDVLVAYGGHSQAAGFSIEEDKIDQFKERIGAFAGKSLKDVDLRKKIDIDAAVDAGDLDWNAWELISGLAPFGYGNRRPVFQVRNGVVVDVHMLREGKHVKFMMKGGSGGILECIRFDSGEWGRMLRPGMLIDIVGYLDINAWNGKESLQFRVTDACSV
ncbi:MAG: single-stranded-DNA-specific exonuclease RecJ, partial [Candidatus Dojkabacteria bacterium]|nr:single-stranded-DNA-specific exonuclease RecJ [Candidatus Dojkabacteria bacterium]